MVTLMFISTGGAHLHVFERDDPIFPAHNPFLAPIGRGTLSTFWYNNSTRAGILGCADSYQICADPRGSLCWDQTNSSQALYHFSGNIQRQRAMYLVTAALEDYHLWSTINYRRGTALNATSQIQRFIGIRLAEEQWKVEVENIFAASLAGMQIRTFDYARGTYANHPNMIDRTPSLLGDNTTNVRAAVDVSKLFKFKNNAYREVSAVGFWGINVLCVALFFSTRRFSTAEKRKLAQSATGTGGHHDSLWATIAWTVLIWRPVKNLGAGIRDRLVKFYPQVLDAFRRMLQRRGSAAHLDTAV
jgi:hypothetical protein